MAVLKLSEMEKIKANRYRLAILIIGILWLIFFDYATQISLQNIIYPDSNSYRSAAENLYVYYRGDHYRPLLISAIYGIPYAIGLGDAAIYQFGFWLNAAFWLASLQLLFGILKSFSKAAIAFGLTLVFLFSIGNTAYLFHLLSETLFILMMLYAFSLLLRYEREGDVYFLPWGLSVLVLSILVRPGIQYFVVFTLLIFVRQLWFHRHHVATKVLYGSITVLIVQCAGLWYQAGNFTVSYIDAPTYYNYLGSRIEQLKGNPPRELGYIYSLPLPEQKKLARLDMRRQLSKHPDLFFKAYEWNLRENATSGTIGVADCKNIKGRSFFARDVFFAISQWQNRLFSLTGLLLGAICLMRRRRLGNVWGLVAIYVLYTILLSAISHSQGDRFSLATYPFTILLFARLVNASKPREYS